MRQLKQHDLDQVTALLDSFGKGLHVIEEMAQVLQKAVDVTLKRVDDWGKGLHVIEEMAQELKKAADVTLKRVDDWGKGDELVTGVPERAEPKTFEIWQPRYHNGWPLTKVGEYPGADFMSAVRGWVKHDLHTYLLWGDPQEIDGQIWAGGVPLFPSKEEAAAWNDKGEKEP